MKNKLGKKIILLTLLITSMIMSCSSNDNNHSNIIYNNFVQKHIIGYPQKVLFLGTSLTASTSISGIWTEYLINDIQLLNIDNNISYSNHAISGSNSNRMLDISEVDCQDTYTVVFIETLINDAYESYNISVEKAIENTNKIINNFITYNNNIEIYLIITNPPYGRHENVRPNWRSYYTIYDTIALDYYNRGFNVYVIDIKSVWDSLYNYCTIHQFNTNNWENYIPDSIHPSNLGCQEIIVPTIEYKLGM